MDGLHLANRAGDWSNQGSGPLYQRLAATLVDLLRLGELRVGDRLPPERQLADALDVSRGTVVAAYDRLRAQGLVERVQGRGTTVIGEAAPAGSRPDRLAGEELFTAPPAAIDLLIAVPDLLPEMVEILTRFSPAEHLDRLGECDPAGLPELRAAIAERTSRDGLPTTPDQIVVTSGAQQGIVLATQTLAGPGDVVLTESDTWPGLADSARRQGSRVVGVPMDGHGIVPDELEAAIQRFRPAFIGLNPHHHNPTGTCLPPSRREAVAALAADYAIPLVEDRVAARLDFRGRVPPPLASHHPYAASATVDSVDKVAWPGLRIGWIRAPHPLAAELRSARAMADLLSSPLTQLVALAVLERLDELVAARTEQLRRRSAAARSALADEVPDWEIGPNDGGLVLWARLPAGVSATAYTEHARRHGVALAGGREFASSTARDDHVRIPYTLPEDILVEAIGRLGRAWRSFRPAEAAVTSEPPRAW